GFGGRGGGDRFGAQLGDGARGGDAEDDRAVLRRQGGGGEGEGGKDTHRNHLVIIGVTVLEGRRFDRPTLRARCPRSAHSPSGVRTRATPPGNVQRGRQTGTPCRAMQRSTRRITTFSIPLHGMHGMHALMLGGAIITPNKEQPHVHKAASAFPARRIPSTRAEPLDRARRVVFPALSQYGRLSVTRRTAGAAVSSHSAKRG